MTRTCKTYDRLVSAQNDFWKLEVDFSLLHTIFLHLKSASTSLLQESALSSQSANTLNNVQLLCATVTMRRMAL